MADYDDYDDDDNPFDEDEVQFVTVSTNRRSLDAALTWIVQQIDKHCMETPSVHMDAIRYTEQGSGRAHVGFHIVIVSRSDQDDN